MSATAEKPGNTFAEAAPKLGVCVRTVKSYVGRRTIEVIEISPRKKFITDDAIERFKAKRTRRAIV